MYQELEYVVRIYAIMRKTKFADDTLRAGTVFGKKPDKCQQSRRLGEQFF